jgi:pimeloyl-ACP methyl ester carboxylesterase
MIWGEHDSIIPASHGEAAHEALPGSELVVLSRSGHFPQLDEPECFLDAVLEFIESTEPAADAMALRRGRISADAGA